MTKTTPAPRVRAINLYTVEQDGQPVAQAMAISQAEAVRLYVESVQQPTMSARLSTPMEARTLAGLPLLQREPAEVGTKTADLFDAAQVPAVFAAEMVPAPAADHVEDILAMVPPQHAPIEAVIEGLASGEQEPAAEQPVEPAEPVAQDASAPAGVALASSESGADDAPADSELKRQAEAAAARRAMGGRPVAMYRNPADGSTWSGRGLKPKWLLVAIEAGRTQDEFLIDPA